MTGAVTPEPRPPARRPAAGSPTGSCGPAGPMPPRPGPDAAGSHCMVRPGDSESVITYCARVAAVARPPVDAGLVGPGRELHGPPVTVIAGSGPGPGPSNSESRARSRHGDAPLGRDEHPSRSPDSDRVRVGPRAGGVPVKPGPVGLNPASQAQPGPAGVPLWPGWPESGEPGPGPPADSVPGPASVPSSERQPETVPVTQRRVSLRESARAAGVRVRRWHTGGPGPGGNRHRA